MLYIKFNNVIGITKRLYRLTSLLWSKIEFSFCGEINDESGFISKTMYMLVSVITIINNIKGKIDSWLNDIGVNIPLAT